QFVLVQLRMARDNRIHHRNSDAAAHVAEQVVESGRITHFFIRQVDEGDGGKRYEDEAGSNATENDGSQKRPLRDVKVSLTEAEAADAEHQEAAGGEPSIVNLSGQNADDRHGQDGTDTTRAHGPARRRCGVVQQFLIEKW